MNELLSEASSPEESGCRRGSSGLPARLCPLVWTQPEAVLGEADDEEDTTASLLCPCFRLGHRWPDCFLPIPNYSLLGGSSSSRPKPALKSVR